jgi:hypothetical protein
VTSRATCRGTRTRGVGEVVDDEPGVVNDKRREAEYSTTSSATSYVTSRATCRGTRTRDVGEVIDDEPGAVDDERRDEPCDEPRYVPRHPDARRGRSSRRRARSSRRLAARGAA